MCHYMTKKDNISKYNNFTYSDSIILNFESKVCGVSLVKIFINEVFEKLKLDQYIMILFII